MLSIFEMVILNTKRKDWMEIPQKLVYDKFYVHEKILRTRNCRRELIKNFLKKTCKPNNRDLHRH